MQFAHMGLIPEGMYANWEYRNSTVQATGIDEDTMSVLYDPQTSGGLLMCIAPEKCPALLERLHELGVHEAAEIGRVVESFSCSQIIVL
jgi:selenide,water dikinase